MWNVECGMRNERATRASGTRRCHAVRRGRQPALPLRYSALRAPHSAFRRRGLAPLELVLSLPLLLFVMALMVNFSVIAAWKVRGLTASRQSMWRDRMIWSAGGDPNSPNWPAGAAMRTSVPNPALLSPNTVNAWEMNPKIVADFVNAPMVNANGGYIQILTKRSLYMAEGLRQGEGDLTRQLAMLPNLKGYQGGFHLDPKHPVLDNRWQFQNIRLPDNHSRRLLDWYNFDDRPEWSSQRSQYLAADAAIQGYPQQNGLLILDRDPELAAFYGNPRHDFYPRVGGCEINPVVAHDTLINPPFSIPPTPQHMRGGLVDRIQGRWPRDLDGDGRPDIPGVAGVAYHVAQRFAGMYTQRRAPLLQGLPPLVPGDTSDDLKDRIDQLNKFMKSVPH